ncbi:MAG TPA: hypothetical protein DDX89_07380 [Candidatus Omnitrophica bacterium]|nr:hypothetical protein [Candidatus Omnitrophota bacterium]
MTSETLDALWEIAETDPLPAGHTSSHWQDHGRRTIVERRRGELVLQASGFDTLAHPGLGGRLLHRVERWSYRKTLKRFASFAAVWRLMERLVHDLGGGADFYALKTACVLATLADHWANDRLSPQVFALIGDGSGLLGALIRRFAPSSRVYSIDLPKALVFQATTHRTADPAGQMGVLTGRDQEMPSASAQVLFVLPQALEQIPGPIDCAVSVASLQEMTADSIAGYFAFLRRRTGPASRFYCVNRLSKPMPGGEVATFSEYPWQAEDEVFLDGPCPYYAYCFSPQTLPNGPRVLGMRVPCVNYFDGVHVHRLVRLAGGS